MFNLIEMLFESEEKVKFILGNSKNVERIKARILSDDKANNNATPEQIVKKLDSVSPAVSKYLPWVVKMYCNGEFEITDTGLVDNYLNDFMKNSSKLQNKDINSYKTLNDLSTAINNVKNQKTSHDLKREAKEGAEVVFEDDKWKVIVPHTQEAAIQYGKNTKWCTASTEHSNMFDHYNMRGPLYINIDKETGKKYQFHFESDSFMNAEDVRDIKIFDKICKDRALLDFYKDKNDTMFYKYLDTEERKDKSRSIRAVMASGSNMQYVPDELKNDKDIVKASLSKSGDAYRFLSDEIKKDRAVAQQALSKKIANYRYMPDELKRDKKFIDQAIEDVDSISKTYKYLPDEIKNDAKIAKKALHSLKNVKDLPDQFKNDKEFILSAIKSGKSSIYKYLPDNMKRDPEIIDKVLKKSYINIQYVPEDLITPEMCDKLMNDHKLTYVFIPDKFKTYDMCIEALRKGGNVEKVIENTPEEFKDRNFWLNAFATSPYREISEKMPEQYKNYDFYKEAVKIDPYAIVGIPDELKDREMCEPVIKEFDFLGMCHVPQDLLTYEDCYKGVQHPDTHTLRSVPQKFRDYNMCLKAVESYYGNIQDVPKDILDVKMCRAAVDNDTSAIEYIPNEFKDYKTCYEAVSNNNRTWRTNLEYVPEKYRDYDMCLAALKNNKDNARYVPEDIMKEIKIKNKPK